MEAKKLENVTLEEYQALERSTDMNKLRLRFLAILMLKYASTSPFTPET